MHRDGNVRQRAHLLRNNLLSGLGHLHRNDDVWRGDVRGECDLPGRGHLRWDLNLL